MAVKSHATKPTLVVNGISYKFQYKTNFLGCIYCCKFLIDNNGSEWQSQTPDCSELLFDSRMAPIKAYFKSDYQWDELMRPICISTTGQMVHRTTSQLYYTQGYRIHLIPDLLQKTYDVQQVFVRAGQLSYVNGIKLWSHITPGNECMSNTLFLYSIFLTNFISSLSFGNLGCPISVLQDFFLLFK